MRFYFETDEKLRQLRTPGVIHIVGRRTDQPQEIQGGERQIVKNPSSSRRWFKGNSDQRVLVPAGGVEPPTYGL